MILPQGALSPIPLPYVDVDINGAAVMYYTDGTTAQVCAGPFPANTLMDFFSGAGGLYWTPFQPRPAGPVLGTYLPPVSPVNTADDYQGSANTDANGLFNYHVSPGPRRRCDVWSYRNRREVDLQVTDPQNGKLTFTTSQTSWQAATPDSFGTIVTGMPSDIDCRYLQTIGADVLATPGSAWGATGIGWGVSSCPWVWPNPVVPSGLYGQFGTDDGNNPGEALGADVEAFYRQTNFFGAVSIYSLVCAFTVLGTASSVVYYEKGAPIGAGNSAAERLMLIRY